VQVADERHGRAGIVTAADLANMLDIKKAP